MIRGGWLLSFLLLGCADPDASHTPAASAGVSPPPPEPAAPARWTVAVYMAADNDLEKEALSDVEEMLTASHQGLRIVVQLDRSGASPFSLKKIPAWAGAQRFEIAERTLSSVGLLGPVDSGSAATLREFVSFAARRAGTDQLAIVLWGHGHGALGLMDDASSNSRLSPRALGEALREGLAEAGAPRAAFVGFDACSMADLSVASEVAPSARWMFASQHRTPASGWSYRVLRDFARAQRDSAADLADLIAQDALNASSPFDLPPAWSLIDLDHALPPRDALSALAALAPPAPEICGVLPPGPTSYTDDGMEDILRMTQPLSALPGLAAPCDDLLAASKASISRRWSWPEQPPGVGLSMLARLPASETPEGEELLDWWERLGGCRDAP